MMADIPPRKGECFVENITFLSLKTTMAKFYRNQLRKYKDEHETTDCDATAPSSAPLEIALRGLAPPTQGLLSI
jgi:hypothetical protein